MKLLCYFCESWLLFKQKEHQVLILGHIYSFQTVEGVWLEGLPTFEFVKNIFTSLSSVFVTDDFPASSSQAFLWTRRRYWFPSQSLFVFITGVSVQY